MSYHDLVLRLIKKLLRYAMCTCKFFLQIKDHLILKKENVIFYSVLWYNHSFAQMCLVIGIVF